MRAVLPSAAIEGKSIAPVREVPLGYGLYDYDNMSSEDDDDVDGDDIQAQKKSATEAIVKEVSTTKDDLEKHVSQRSSNDDKSDDKAVETTRSVSAEENLEVLDQCAQWTTLSSTRKCFATLLGWSRVTNCVPRHTGTC